MRPLGIESAPNSSPAIARKITQSAAKAASVPVRLADLDGRAFAAALARLKPLMLRFCRSFACSPDDAEDLIQESIIRAWMARDSFIPGSSLEAWLFTILRNRFYSFRRHVRVQEATLRSFADTLVPPTTVQTEMDLRHAASAISLLPEKQREALILIGICGFTYADVAVLTNTPLGTIKSRVSRARPILRETIEKRNDVMPFDETDDAFEQWLAQVEDFRVLGLALLAGRHGGPPPSVVQG